MEYAEESPRDVQVEIRALVSAVRDWAGLPEKMTSYAVFAYLDTHFFLRSRNRRIARDYRESATRLVARYRAANSRVTMDESSV
jgi:hypothetical protein